jgi:hypothetical protein
MPANTKPVPWNEIKRLYEAGKAANAIARDMTALRSWSPALKDQESLVLTALMFHRELSGEAISEILWPSAAHMPDQWHCAVRVLICRVRCKIRPHGWTVATRYGIGWRLERLIQGEQHDRRAPQEAPRAAA